jgi:hypothetical protein
VFKIDDRVRVSSDAPVLKNLAGREGTVVELLEGGAMLGPPMVSVHLDRLEMAAVVPFYYCELINLSEEN